MEEVQQSLETNNRTSPLADVIAVWVDIVEHLAAQLDDVDPDAAGIAKAVERAVSSAKGMQPIDYRSDE